MLELKNLIHHLHTQLLAIPFIDPFDLRYSNRIKVPKPMTQAVMFCIMDVSGSMDETRKDTAKRFFILLYLFLKRAYDKIEVVFIRHHTAAAEVDEEEFFHSRESGGTVVSSALHLLDKIIDERYGSGDWNSYVAQASDGDNWDNDSVLCKQLLINTIMPTVQYYTYVEITDGPPQNLWEQYAEVRRPPPATSPCRRSSRRPTSIRCSANCSRSSRNKRRLASEDHHAQRSATPARPARAVGVDLRPDRARARGNPPRGQAASASTPIPNQLEIITAEQMMDAYTSVGMPVSYNHWSFGKHFLSTEKSYKRGQMGLAYEIVINSNPCIAYLMEENSLTMQALVIAHAAYGHNSFFKGNYLFRTWTDADAIVDYMVFAKNYIAECEQRHGIDAVELLLDSCHALQNYGVDRYKRPAKLSLAQENARQKEREEYVQSQVNDLWRTVPRRDERERRRAAAALPARAARKTCCTSSRNTRRCWNPGSARWCASCARSPSTSIRSARPRS